MEFSVEIKGLDSLQKALGVTQELMDQEVNKALFAAAKHVEKEAKQSILDGQKSGRIYKRRTVTHQASAPGEAPASDTGRLVNSINAYIDRNQQTGFVTAGRGTVNYAALLEFGTKKMAPRPFMFPALEKSRDWIRERLATAMQNALKRAGR